MSARWLITILLVVTFAGVFWGAISQGRQLSELRGEQRQLEAGKLAANTPVPETIATPSPTPEAPRELLQLRAEVARLSQQQRELSGVRGENGKLRLQLENRRTNDTRAQLAGVGYIRVSETKWVGCNTPEDTLQSAFWAVQNQDLAKFLETIRPDVAKEIADSLRKESRSAPEFFKDRHLPPFFKIAGRRQSDDDDVTLEVQIAPDVPGELILFQQVGGQWKLQSPH